MGKTEDFLLGSETFRLLMALFTNSNHPMANSLRILGGLLEKHAKGGLISCLLLPIYTETNQPVYKKKIVK